MDFDITKVSIDGSVDDLSEDQLRELVSKFQDAQESNVAEFEKAAEAIDGVDEDSINDFEDARETLIEDITEAEAFDEVPLTEDKLEDEDFSELQEWMAFVADDTPEGDEGDGEDGEGDFDDFGQRSPTNFDADDDAFVEDQLGDMPGFEL